MERGANPRRGGAETKFCNAVTIQDDGRRARRSPIFSGWLLWRGLMVLPCEPVTWLVAFLSK